MRQCQLVSGILAGSTLRKLYEVFRTFPDKVQACKRGRPLGAYSPTRVFKMAACHFVSLVFLSSLCIKLALSTQTRGVATTSKYKNLRARKVRLLWYRYNTNISNFSKKNLKREILFIGFDNRLWEFAQLIISDKTLKIAVWLSNAFAVFPPFQKKYIFVYIIQETWSISFCLSAILKWLSFWNGNFSVILKNCWTEIVAEIFFSAVATGFRTLAEYPAQGQRLRVPIYKCSRKNYLAQIPIFL